MQRPSLAFALALPQAAFEGPASVDGTPVSRGTASPLASPAHARAPLQAPSPTRPDRVSVIAPGGGTGINSAVYAELGRDPRFRVEIVGQSRAPYDCYPETWPNGGPAPNLVSFAQEVLNQGVLERTDCLVVGSRGGQVVLPHFWQMRGAAVPPAVCMNGGVAMGLPTRVCWPDSAPIFILIGGQDNFRGNFTAEEYVADTKSRVPQGSGTTAILYVEEMHHMPQAKLLAAVMPHMIRAVLSWKAERVDCVLDEFRLILRALNSAGWSGRLLFTKAAGIWEEVEFSPYQVWQSHAVAVAAARAAAVETPTPIELTRHDEMQALWWAAVCAAQPGGGAPLAGEGARLAAAAEALRAQALRSQAAAQAMPLLPPAAVAGRGEGTPFVQTPQAGSGRPRALSDLTPVSRALGIARAPHGSPVRLRSSSVAFEMPPPVWA